MKKITFFILVISSCSTSVLAQAVTEQGLKAELANPTVPSNGKSILSAAPLPGTKIVPAAPAQAAQNDLIVQKPLQTTEIMPTKVDVIALPIQGVNTIQAKMTEQQKATIAGKTVRPKTIDQTTGATEGKLTPIQAIPIQAKPILAPVVQN